MKRTSPRPSPAQEAARKRAWELFTLEGAEKNLMQLSPTCPAVANFISIAVEALRKASAAARLNMRGHD